MGTAGVWGDGGTHTSRLLALAFAVALIAAGSLPFAARAGGGPGGGQPGYGPHVREARAVLACATHETTPGPYRTCLERTFLQLLEQVGDTADELPRIDVYVDSTGGWLPLNCHLIMHAVGRRFGAIEHVTLGNLLRYLPKSNDPGCSAGFAHGLLISIAPQIMRAGPKTVAAECARAGTRYERYSCVHGLGHAYARIYLDFPLPALGACRELGAEDAVDCAQGVFHDYWIAVSGLDGTHHNPEQTTSPRVLCGRYTGGFARACWYRAMVERPPHRPVDSARAMLAVCAGLAGLQEKACITGASVVRSGDPNVQMASCAELPARFGVACARGVRIPAAALAPASYRLQLAADCRTFPRSARYGCYWWLGKGLNVITNGRFARVGCPYLGNAFARNACSVGAGAYDGPLVTFS